MTIDHPGLPPVIIVEIPRLRAMIVARLAQHFDATQADLMADAVLFGELIGRPSHGILRILPGTFGATDEEPGPSPHVERLGRATARIDGRPGILVASMAAQMVADLASKEGLAMVTTTGSRSTSGSLTYYVEKITNVDCVALVSASTLPFVTFPGGIGRLLGTNPLAIGMPAIGYPFIADMTTSAISGGDVVAAAASGSPPQLDVGVDQLGNAAVDPGDVLKGGALLPFGGHKGLGLSMAVELLNGALAAAPPPQTGASDAWGHVFMAISLAQFDDPELVKQRAQAIIDRFSSAPTNTGKPVRIPGHQSLATRDANLAGGTVTVATDSYERLVSRRTSQHCSARTRKGSLRL